jgi:hypothetical protein
MFYRAVAILIVLFWLTMTGLLMHQEIRPGDSAMREIPVSHVVKLMFMHQREPGNPPPLLSIYSDKLRLGQLRLTPQIDAQTQDRNLDFKGDLQVSVLGGKRERIGWSGRFDMDKLLNIKRFQLTITTHYPTDLITDMIIIPGENIAHYELRTSGGTVDRQDFTLDEHGARAALEHAGIDPALLPISRKQQAAADFTAKARLSSLAVHGGQMDTYLVTIESNGQTLLECHVDQLGRIVQATTLLGYSLSPEDITP